MALIDLIHKGQSATSAVLAWVGIVLLIFAYVLAYDLWAHYTGHRTMTNQFRQWLHDPIWGPIIAALWAAAFIGLTFHFLINAHR